MPDVVRGNRTWLLFLNVYFVLKRMSVSVFVRFSFCSTKLSDGVVWEESLSNNLYLS